ncbi:hypothetical protein NE236_41460 [Actinoallomurus purpureus]|uniref:hypothetical protein n=1 Tax=Actinoallomurus purpureus TaxID=478114 RepID=UPI002092568E|nr:hypothetical protein [Actinoallomurus purpureus]MCO6011437.1 hypothetical protein [Actinoallomurus purpureus]
MSEPEWLREMREAMENATQVMIVQAAMGWMFRGDLEQARAVLTTLPTDKMNEVSAAATALASLVDEVAQEAR